MEVMKTEPARLVAAILALMILAANALGYAIGPEDEDLMRRGVEALVEIAGAVGLLEYLRRRVFSPATHERAVEEERLRAS